MMLHAVQMHMARSSTCIRVYCLYWVCPGVAEPRVHVCYTCHPRPRQPPVMCFVPLPSAQGLCWLQISQGQKQYMYQSVRTHCNNLTMIRHATVFPSRLNLNTHVNKLTA